MASAHEHSTWIGARVSRYRRAAGINQDQLARLAGVSQPTVSRIERGEGAVDAATAMRLASGLGVDLAALLGPVLVDEDMVAAARPGSDVSAMNQMRAAARDYLADYRHVLSLS